MSKGQAANATGTHLRGKKTFRILITSKQRMKRIHRKPFAILMTQQERDTTERNAAAKGLSASAYLRTLGLGYEPRPVLDAGQVDGLLTLAGELVRLSELLKSWLNEQPGRGMPESDVRQLFAQIMETRAQLAARAGVAMMS